MRHSARYNHLMPPLRCLVLPLLVSGSNALAGQLITDTYGLAEVKQQGGSVVAGTVESFAKGKTKRDFSLTVKVTRVFGDPKHAPAPGERYTVRVYDGIEWTDPRRSPIDRRLRNAVGPVVEKGKTVYLAASFPGAKEVELLEGTPANLTRLEVHFDDAARKRWLASPAPLLEAALADEELAPLAFTELSRRGPVRAEPLLSADLQLVRAHLASLPAAARSLFFKDALALAKADPAKRDALFDLTCLELRSAWLADVAPLAELLPAKQTDEGRRFFALRDELDYLLARVEEKTEKQRPDLTPFVPYLARWLLVRPAHQSTDDELTALFPFISAAGKQQLASRLINELPTSTRSKAGEPDLYLLDVADALVKLAPSTAVLPALGNFDPSSVRVTSEREGAMGSLLSIGLSIARANPSARRQVQELLEPWLAGGVEADEESVAAWRKAMPPWKPPAPLAAKFELVPGQIHRMNNGARFSFTQDAKDYGFSWEEGDNGRSMGLPSDEDWYAEQFWKPWLVTVRRVGREAKLEVSATPVKGKLEPLGDPQVHKLLEAQAGKDGCPQYEDAVYDESNGTFSWKASGPKGKTCSYLFGLFSRKMQRTVITP